MFSNAPHHKAATQKYALLLLTLFIAFFNTAAFSATNERCEEYVQNSLKQNKKNIANACAFSGSRWNNNAHGQKKWCMTTNEASLLLETSERNKMLHACKVKHQQQGKTYTEVGQDCMPSDPSLVRRMTKEALYACLLGNNEAVIGSKDGYDYLLYIHAFKGRESYLYNFVSSRNGLVFNSHYLGDAGEQCTESEEFYARKEYSGFCHYQVDTCSFKVSVKREELSLTENCGTHGGDRYSSVGRDSLYVLNHGVWELTKLKYGSSGGDIDGFSHSDVIFIDWKTQQYCSGGSHSTIRDWLNFDGETSQSAKITSTAKISISDIYNKYKLGISSGGVAGLKKALSTALNLSIIYGFGFERCQQLS